MAKQWYVRNGGKTIGPVTSSVLKQMARSGIVKQTSMVSRDKRTWFPASNVKGLWDSDVVAKDATSDSTPTPLRRKADSEKKASSLATRVQGRSEEIQDRVLPRLCRANSTAVDPTDGESTECEDNLSELLLGAALLLGIGFAGIKGFTAVMRWLKWSAVLSGGLCLSLLVLGVGTFLGTRLLLAGSVSDRRAGAITTALCIFLASASWHEFPSNSGGQQPFSDSLPRAELDSPLVDPDPSRATTVTAAGNGSPTSNLPKPQHERTIAAAQVRIPIEPAELRLFNEPDEQLFLMYTAEDTLFSLINYDSPTSSQAEGSTARLAMLHARTRLYLQYIHDQNIGAELEKTYEALLACLDAHADFLKETRALTEEYDREMANRSLRYAISNSLRIVGGNQRLQQSGMSTEEAAWATLGLAAIEFASQVTSLKQLNAERKRQIELKADRCRASWFRFCTIAESASGALGAQKDWTRDMQPFRGSAQLLASALDLSREGDSSAVYNLLEESRKNQHTKNPYSDLYVAFLPTIIDPSTPSGVKGQVGGLDLSTLVFRMSAMNVPAHRIYDLERLRWLNAWALFADYRMRLCAAWDTGAPLGLGTADAARQCVEPYNYAMYYSNQDERLTLRARRMVALYLAGNQSLAMSEARALSDSGYDDMSFHLDYAKILAASGRTQDARREIVRAGISEAMRQSLKENVYLRDVVAK